MSAIDNLDSSFKFIEHINKFKIGADKKDANCQCNLAVMYEYGQGRKEDYKTAVDLYTLSSKQGNIVAKNNLGYMYMNGKGCEKNYKKAFELFTEAVDNSSAYHNLGYMYQNGWGCEKDYTKAIKYYTLAAEKGNKNAQIDLQKLLDKKIDKV